MNPQRQNHLALFFSVLSIHFLNKSKVSFALRRGSHHLLLQPPLRWTADGRVRLVPHLDPHHVHRPQEARPRSRGVALLQVRGEEEQDQGRRRRQYSGKMTA